MGDLWLWENHSKRELRVLYKEEDLKEYENIKKEIRKAEQAGDFDYDRSVDKTLIRGIEQGFWELTHELFFQCIRQSPRYLSYEPFIKKILQWQETLYDKYEVNGKFKTKENLKKIGIELSFEGSGRRPLNNNPSTSTN